jgi:acetyltransferase-like isoleucine patch superfamily enzyme
MIYRVINKLHSLWLAYTYPFHKIGKRVSISRSCKIDRAFAKYISIGDGVYIADYVWINVPEVPADGKPVIFLEDYCSLGRHNVVSAKNQIHIERNVLFAPSVLVTDHNHEFADTTTPIKAQGTSPGGTVRIEQGSWIGFGAAILGSSGSLVIGRNSVVGANSVVNRSVAPCTVVAGNPAKPIKHFDPAKKQWLAGGGTPESRG